MEIHRERGHGARSKVRSWWVQDWRIETGRVVEEYHGTWTTTKITALFKGRLSENIPPKELFLVAETTYKHLLFLDSSYYGGERGQVNSLMTVVRTNQRIFLYYTMESIIINKLSDWISSPVVHKESHNLSFYHLCYV